MIKIRNIKRAERDQKLKLVANMYGDPEAGFKQEQLELDQMRQEIDLEIQKIQAEITSSELDNNQRDKVRKMAMKTARNSMK